MNRLTQFHELFRFNENIRLQKIKRNVSACTKRNYSQLSNVKIIAVPKYFRLIVHLKSVRRIYRRCLRGRVVKIFMKSKNIAKSTPWWAQEEFLEKRDQHLVIKNFYNNFLKVKTG